MPVKPVKVVHVGLGPIGAAIVRQVDGRKGFRSVGAVDTDPAKAGADLGDEVALGRRLRIKVSADLAATLEATRPDVVVLCTASSLRTVIGQIETVLKARVPIVSTTEELVYPAPRNRALVRKIDALARKARVAVLGTGVNPGFVMDTLPIVLTGVCGRVDGIHVDRIQDARSRRLPFQQKIGSGLTLDQFARRVEDGSVRHVGLAESIQMLGDALGWKIEKITDDIQPKVAGSRVSSEHLTVEPGLVCGIVQDGVGYSGGKAVITLHMEAYLGAPETYDAVRIDGSPALHVKIIGGTHGDVATASIAVNSIPKVLAAAPGYRTMRDLPIPSFFRGQVGYSRA